MADLVTVTLTSPQDDGATKKRKTLFNNCIVEVDQSMSRALTCNSTGGLEIVVVPPRKRRKKRWRKRRQPTSVKLFYALYEGYELCGDSVPFHFWNPSEALTWGISRWKKDGIGNGFLHRHPPSIFQFVGMTVLREENIEIVDRPYKMHSQIEENFFSSVVFLKIRDPSLVIENSYMKCNNDVYLECLSKMKAKQDYQLSSNSIYVSNEVCPTDNTGNSVSFFPSSVLANKSRVSSSGFIQLEASLRHFKENTYCDLGELLYLF